MLGEEWKWYWMFHAWIQMTESLMESTKVSMFVRSKGFQWGKAVGHFFCTFSSYVWKWYETFFNTYKLPPVFSNKQDCLCFMNRWCYTNTVSHGSAWCVLWGGVCYGMCIFSKFLEYYSISSQKGPRCVTGTSSHSSEVGMCDCVILVGFYNIQYVIFMFYVIFIYKVENTKPLGRSGFPQNSVPAPI